MTRKSLAASEHRGWATILRHRWPTLVGIVAGTLALVDDGVDGSRVTTQLAVITLIVAVAYLPIAAARRQLRDPRVLVLETAGVLVFGALALGALLVEGRTAQYLLAAAWLGHGAWDVAHHLADRVVPRWYAEICAVLDVLVAVGSSSPCRTCDVPRIVKSEPLRGEGEHEARDRHHRRHPTRRDCNPIGDGHTGATYGNGLPRDGLVVGPRSTRRGMAFRSSHPGDDRCDDRRNNGTRRCGRRLGRAARLL